MDDEKIVVVLQSEGGASVIGKLDVDMDDPHAPWVRLREPLFYQVEKPEYPSSFEADIRFARPFWGVPPYATIGNPINILEATEALIRSYSNALHYFKNKRVSVRFIADAHSM